MKIAVLSGKGGTGKTTLAVNLFAASKNSILIDADVEEPNCHIFIKPNIRSERYVHKGYPVINDNCTLCGACGDFCNFNAILPAKNDVLVFKELCHDCGGCKLVCKENAIEHEKRSIGKIYESTNMSYGLLDVGEVSAVEVIEDLKESIDSRLAIIDSPPGTACATVAAISGCDYAIIVSEPTPFGVSDMKMVVELLRNMNINFGVVINKAGLGNDEIYDYLNSEKIDILAEIPFSEEIAKTYASGKMLSNIKGYKKIMKSILEKVIS